MWSHGDTFNVVQHPFRVFRVIHPPSHKSTSRKLTRLLRSEYGLCGSNLAAVSYLCFARVVAQFTAFDGVIIAASMSPCAARRSSLMLWA